MSPDIIAKAIGDTVQGIGQIATVVGENINLSEKSYFGALKQQGPPIIKDWFAKYKTDYTGQMMYLIFGMFAIIGIGIVGIAFSKNKN